MFLPVPAAAPTAPSNAAPPFVVNTAVAADANDDVADDAAPLAAPAAAEPADPAAPPAPDATPPIP